MLPGREGEKRGKGSGKGIFGEGSVICRAREALKASLWGFYSLLRSRYHLAIKLAQRESQELREVSCITIWTSDQTLFPGLLRYTVGLELGLGHLSMRIYL